MPYTFKDAGAEVGASTDWEVGRRASIKKWEQIAAGDEEAYVRTRACGMCFVCSNRALGCSSDNCPAYPICDVGLGSADPQTVIDALKQLELPKEVKE